MRALVQWFRFGNRRLRAWLILGITILYLAIALHPVHAQERSPVAQESTPTTQENVSVAQNISEDGNAVDGYPVVLDGKELFRVRQGIPGVVSAQERAEIINDRIVEIANDPSTSLNSIRAEEQNGATVVMAGDTVLFTVNDADRTNNQTRQETADKAAQFIQAAVTQYRRDRSVESLVIGIILAIVSTIALAVFLVLLQRFSSRLLTRIKVARQADALDFNIQGFQVFSSNVTGYLLSGTIRLVRLVLIIGAFYLYLPFVLSQFPATKAFGKSILSDIAHRFSALAETFVQFLPNFVTIGLIALITFYVIQFAKLVITELGRDDAYPWFYQEWIRPTNRLATILLVAIGCIVAAPYIPGFNSPAFQGVSLFLGALLTLGSSSAVANAIAGIILIYTRAFRIGDVIQIGDTRGEVLDKSLFVTRLLTFKKEVITVPNSAVLNSSVVNFNASSRESINHLVLHTTITLGYDVPWRKIHDVLTQAAVATSGIVSDPQPFVLQTALNDFNVSYELNAYSDRPEIMPRIYSELHQNIQDYCNQAGIEILSPGYTSLRDGNHSTIPENYLPDDYVSPGFQIQPQNNQG